MSTGDYYRFDLHKERARRLSILAQPSRVGRPRYLETADLTDWARITRKALQRVAQVATLNGVDGAEAWKLEATVGDNNFIIKGGDNTDDGAKAAWLGGLRALLYRDTDYSCTLNAPNEQDLFAIHHKATAIANNLVTDTASKYVVNALVGYEIHIEGAGEFTVTANTPSTITLAGFNPGDYGFTDASRPYYWIALKAPVAGATQAVYLDVHIEDWGMAEDAELNHNPRGAPVEWARREVLIQRIFVNQNNEMPIVDYNDSLGRKHYVLKIGAIVRQAGNDAIPEVNDDNREDQASSAQEILDARGFAHFEVGVDHNGDGTISSAQPTTLAERLAREESLLVVGPTGDPGIYTGPDGLLEALAIGNGAPGAPHTVFLRNGIYDFSSKGTIVVPAGWTLTGESKGVALVLDSTADIGLKIESGAKVENVYVTCTSGDNPGVLLAGSNSYLGRGPMLSRCVVSATILSGDNPAVLVRGYESETTGVVTGGATIRDCQIFKLRGVAVKVELRNVGAAVQNSARAAFSNGTSSDVDSYHVNIENCRIYSGRQLASAGAFKKTNAALNISTHASVLVNRTLLVGDENPALYISGSNATAFRHQVFFSDCTFLGLCRDGEISGVGVPSLVSAAYQPFTELDLARVEGGSTIFDSCLWDTFHPGLAFASLSTGPVSLLAVSDTPAVVPLAAQISTCRFEVNGGTSITSTSVGLSVRVLEAGSSVEVSGCTARVLDAGYPKALYYLENHSNVSAVSIHDSSADNGNRLGTGFFLVGNVTASDIKSFGGVAGPDVILTRAQVEAAGSTGLRIDTVNLFGVTLDTPAITQVNGFKASACGGVGVAILGSAAVPFSRASLSDIVIDGLHGTTSATSVGVVADNYFGITIDGLSLGGIKSCGVFCSNIEIGCAVNGVTVHEVGTAHDFTNPSTTPWYGAALVNVMHSRDLKFFNRSRSAGVPAKMHLAAYYSNGSSATSATASGYDIHGGSATNGIQAGRVGASYIGSLFISDCHMNAVSRAIILYEGVTAHISACNIFNFLAYGVYISGSARVDVVSTEMVSTVVGSAAVLATQSFDQLRISGCRLESMAKAVFANGGREVLVHNTTLMSGIPQTTSVANVARLEITSTTMSSNQPAPKTFNRADPTSTALTLICNAITQVVVSDCKLRIGAVVFGCRQVSFDSCDFSTIYESGLIFIPPTASPSQAKLEIKNCTAWGKPSASQAELQCAIWASPIRDFNEDYSYGSWGGRLIIAGGSYYGGVTHGDLFVSDNTPRAAVIRADMLDVNISGAYIQVSGESSAAVLAGNMDYIVASNAPSTSVGQHRFGVDRFQFRNNEIYSASSGVVIAVLKPGYPHEIRDNLFSSNTEVGATLFDRNCFFITTSEDEDNAFGGNNDYMTRVLYTGNCHMIMGAEQYSGELSSPAYAGIVTSYSVCLDAFGNLQRESDAIQTSAAFIVDGFISPNKGLGMVEKLNSIRRIRGRIDTEGVLIEENLRVQEW